MQGWIKFYNKEKGYGFIYTSEDTQDISFGINEWRSAEQPQAGYEVDFEATANKKGGFKAINVFLIKKNEDKSPDERISCPCCHKKIVPRISFYKGSPRRSYCPYCGGVVKKFFQLRIILFPLFIMILIILIYKH
jgi:cold shock CspA family protein